MNPLVEMATDVRNQIMVRAGLKVTDIRRRYAKSNNPLKQTACFLALNPLNRWFEKAIPRLLKKE